MSASATESCAPPLKHVVDEVIFRHADAHFCGPTLSELKRHKYDLYCEDVSRRVLELLLCPPGTQMDCDKKLGGTLHSNNKSIDSFYVDAAAGTAAFLQTKSQEKPLDANFVCNWVATAKLESGDPKYGMRDPPAFARTFAIAAHHLHRDVRDMLPRIRAENTNVTVLIFKFCSRQNTDYYVPYDEWTWSFISSAVMRSARVRPELERLRHRIDTLHADFHSDAFHLPALCPAPPAEAPVDDAAGKRKREKGPLDVYCHELANVVSQDAAVGCTRPGCGRWVSCGQAVTKFHASVHEIRADPAWVCWHCRGQCSLNSCVRKREGGGKTAKKIEKLLASVGVTDNYHSALVNAVAAGHASVREWLAVEHPALVWGA